MISTTSNITSSNESVYSDLSLPNFGFQSWSPTAGDKFLGEVLSGLNIQDRKTASNIENYNSDAVNPIVIVTPPTNNVGSKTELAYYSQQHPLEYDEEEDSDNTTISKSISSVSTNDLDIKHPIIIKEHESPSTSAAAILAATKAEAAAEKSRRESTRAHSNKNQKKRNTNGHSNKRYTRSPSGPHSSASLLLHQQGKNILKRSSMFFRKNQSTADLKITTTDAQKKESLDQEIFKRKMSSPGFTIKTNQAILPDIQSTNKKFWWSSRK